MLFAGQRVNLKDRGTAAHDLDGLPVRIVTPLVTGGLGPRIKQRVERAGPDAAVRRQPITDSLAKYIHGRIAARAVARPARGAGKPHGKAGCRLDTSRQRCRRADTRKRQGHCVRAAVAAPADRREGRARSVSIRHRAAARSGARWIGADRLGAAAGPRSGAQHLRSPSSRVRRRPGRSPQAWRATMRNNRIARTGSADQGAGKQTSVHRSYAWCPVQVVRDHRIRRTGRWPADVP